MSSPPRTNKWTSRLVVVLQLATWSAVSIVLLHKGINSLQRRMLEANHVAEWQQSSGDLNVGNEREQSTDRSKGIVTPVDSGSSRGSHWNRFVLNINKSALGGSLGIVSGERSSALPQSDPFSPSENSTRDSSTGDKEIPISQTKGNNFSPEMDERDPGGKSTSSKLPQVVHSGLVEREETTRIFSQDTARYPEEPTRTTSRLTLKGEENRDAAVETLDFASEWTSSSREKLNVRVSTADTFWRRKDGTFLRHVSTSGAVMAITMIVAGTVMLLVGPAVVILRLLDEMRRARESRRELSSATVPDEDLPPTYEQVVLLNEEAPRYSTLALSS